MHYDKYMVFVYNNILLLLFHYMLLFSEYWFSGIFCVF